ncbi:MAG: type II secretion system protein [Candidatus Spyradosoma sp.]
MKKSQTNRKGFTLIELLTVIAIIGILAALAVPTIGIGMDKVRQLVASNNLSQIAKSYVSYMQEGTNGRQITNKGDEPERGTASTVASVAEILARKAGLVDAEVWYVASDDAINNTIPKTVLSDGTDGTNQLREVKPISWAVVVNAKKNPKAGKSAYPIAWLRGLQTNGEWSEDAPFGKDVGFVAFADGSVKKYSNLLAEEDQFRSADGKRDSSSYEDAIGSNTSSGGLTPTRLEDQGA